MTWQAHVTGHAPLPPPTGRDKGEDTQVELVLLEHSFEHHLLAAILSFLTVLVIFNILASIENKRTSSKLLIICVIILNRV
jgi:hypothetical protein